MIHKLTWWPVKTRVEKYLGKMTVPKFQRIVKRLPEIREQMHELPEFVKSWRKNSTEEIFDKDFYWAAVYEFPLAQQIALLILALGKVQKFLEIARSPDPQQASLEWMDVDDMDGWSGGEGGIFQKEHVVGLVVTLQRTSFRSCSITDRSPRSSLMCAVRYRRRDDSVFLAVRIDRSVLACPTFADRLARAELAQMGQCNFSSRAKYAAGKSMAPDGRPRLGGRAAI